MNTACVNPICLRTTAEAVSQECGPPRLAVVVPCHNEADSLEVLAAGLARLAQALADQYEIEIILVDDGSTDGTWEMLHRFDEFVGGQAEVRLARHESNRGLAAAISTGLTQARAEIVASLDADCTYDPLQLVAMLKLMEANVDLVVASPYHPDGAVVGVAPWRLALSRMASGLYRRVMRNKLHTYTSCLRVYRRQSVIDLPLCHDGFVGVVELVWQLDRRGRRIVECPAVLTTRKTGQSKMRLFRTAVAHLSFLARAAWTGLRQPRIAPKQAIEASPA